MPLEPYVIEGFTGLNLAVDPLEAGTSAATDLHDVDFDKRGRVRTRGGFARVKALTMDTPEGLAVFDEVSTHQFVVGYTTGGTSKYEAYASTGGAALASVNVTSTAGMSAVRLGSSNYLYLANAIDTVRRWDGSAFTSPAGMPIAQRLAVAPRSDRLVAASITGTSTSRVKFSDPGAPETFGANNFVDLVPGDGFITSATTWRDNTFVFKDRAGFFVFDSESTDSDGSPIFNYNAVRGFGAWDSVAGDEGVYFHDGRTVWLTVGSTPTRVSEPVEPFLRGEVSVNGETVDQDQVFGWRLSYSLGLLYIAVMTSGAVRRTLVFDPKLNTWTLYSLPVSFARTLRLDISTLKPQTYWLSTAGVEKFDGSATDNGSAVSWSVQSGKYPLSDPGRVAVSNESSIDGYGTVSLRLDSDLYSNMNGSATLGTAPAFAEGWVAGVDIEGRWLQHTLSGSGAAQVNRLTHHVSYVKPAGVR